MEQAEQVVRDHNLEDRKKRKKIKSKKGILIKKNGLFTKSDKSWLTKSDKEGLM